MPYELHPETAIRTLQHLLYRTDLNLNVAEKQAIYQAIVAFQFQIALQVVPAT